MIESIGNTAISGLNYLQAQYGQYSASKVQAGVPQPVRQQASDEIKITSSAYSRNEQSQTREKYSTLQTKAQDALTAGAELGKIQDKLQRIKDLASQAASKELNSFDRGLLQQEMASLKKSVAQMAQSSPVGGIVLFSGATDINGIKTDEDKFELTKLNGAIDAVANKRSSFRDILDRTISSLERQPAASDVATTSDAQELLGKTKQIINSNPFAALAGQANQYPQHIIELLQ